MRCLSCRIILTADNNGPTWAYGHCDRCAALIFDQRQAQLARRVAPVDPALFENLQEMLAIAREIGAQPHVFTDRTIARVRLSSDVDDTTLFLTSPARTIVILAFDHPPHTP